MISPPTINKTQQVNGQALNTTGQGRRRSVNGNAVHTASLVAPSRPQEVHFWIARLSVLVALTLMAIYLPFRLARSVEPSRFVRPRTSSSLRSGLDQRIHVQAKSARPRYVSVMQAFESLVFFTSVGVALWSAFSLLRAISLARGGKSAVNYEGLVVGAAIWCCLLVLSILLPCIPHVLPNVVVFLGFGMAVFFIALVGGIEGLSNGHMTEKRHAVICRWLLFEQPIQTAIGVCGLTFCFAFACTDMVRSGLFSHPWSMGGLLISGILICPAGMYYCTILCATRGSVNRYVEPAKQRSAPKLFDSPGHFLRRYAAVNGDPGPTHKRY